MVKMFRKLNTKTAIVAIACLVLICCTAGGVFAYLTSKPDSVTNHFTPAKVSCVIEETFENGVKSDVKVRNTGDVNAYIRAVVVVTFRAENGTVHSAAPVEGVHYTVQWSDSGWTKGTDGFWYYMNAVSPDGLTDNLIETTSVLSVLDGYRLNIQIVATAIQSEPVNAVEEAWGITPINDKLIPN